LLEGIFEVSSSLTSAKCQVKKSPIHGYGVFATRELLPGEIIEECRLLQPALDDPALYDYYFDMQGERSLALGNGSLYNHSNEPNGTYMADKETLICTFTATRHIQAGEEILVSYGNDWFSSRSMPLKQPSLWSKLRKRLTDSMFLVRFVCVLSVLIVLLKVATMLVIKSQ
jgi:SET domain-containing protein